MSRKTVASFRKRPRPIAVAVNCANYRSILASHRAAIDNSGVYFPNAKFFWHAARPRRGVAAGATSNRCRRENEAELSGEPQVNDDEVADSETGWRPRRLGRCIDKLAGVASSIDDKIQAVLRLAGLAEPEPSEEVARFIGKQSETKFAKAKRNFFFLLILPFVVLEEGIRSIFTLLIAAMIRLPTLIRQMWCREFLFGAPALAMFGVGLYAFLFSAPPTARALTTAYAEAAQLASGRSEYDAAKLFQMRAIDLSPDRQALIYELGLYYEAAGEMDAAEATMTGVGMAEPVGYGPARIWLADRVLASNLRRSDALAQAELLLTPAGEQTHCAAEAHQRLGRICYERNRLDEAERHFTLAAATMPVARFELARVQAVRGKGEMAKVNAEQSLGIFQRASRSDPGNIQARLVLAHNLMFLERFPESLEVLREGLTGKQTPDPRFGRAIAEVYGAWADQSITQKRSDLAINYLREALKFDAANAAIFARLEKMLADDAAGSRQVRAVLYELLRSGTSPEMVHLLLANDAWRRGKQTEAIHHLELVHRLDVKFAAATNNFAWYLAHGANPDLPRALQLAESAVAAQPENIAFRDTRGRILQRMGQSQRAIGDLVAALKIAKDDPDLHKALAEAYRNLGMNDAAASHSKFASDIRSAPRRN